jgi:hypothetical protein
MDGPDEKFVALKSLWDRKRGDQAMPLRSSFSTKELGPWLGNLAIIEIHSELIRLCGTNLISRFGRDATRCKLSDLQEPVSHSIRTYIERAKVTKTANYGVHNTIIVGYHVSFQELILPMRKIDADVAIIILCSYPTDTKPAWH